MSKSIEVPKTADAFSQSILDYLSLGVEAARARFNPDSGKFLAENGGWAVTNQDVIYPLALLCVTPGSRHCGSQDILDMAFRGGDALRDCQDDCGQVEFVKPDGSRWGKTFMCWSMYHWLQAYDLLRDRLDARRRRRWEDGLRLAYLGVMDELGPEPRIHNIPCWHGMGLTRAGTLLGEPRMLEAGRMIIHRIVATQDPDGFWPEGGGPTTHYNLVYVHAAGLYYWFTGDESVLPALERATDFHLAFTYPDGSPVETVDGRVRHHGHVALMGLPGFAPFDRGRAYIRWMVDMARRHDPAGALVPALVDVYRYCPKDQPDAQAPQQQTQYAHVHHGRAMVRREGPWFYCLSGYLTATASLASQVRNRWYLDRQNYLGVWHERAGLVVGGGNSRGGPQFSTFEVVQGRTIRIQADSAELDYKDGRDMLRLTYGPVVCEVAVSLLDGGRMAVSFRALSSGAAARDGEGTVRANFSLPNLAGKALSGPWRPDAAVLDPLATQELGWPAGTADSQRRLHLGALRIDFPPDSEFSWPEYPFNPYAVNNVASPGAAVGVMTTTLAVGGEPKTFVLSVEDGA